MKRLFMLMLVAFVLALTSPLTMHNAAADPATDATDQEMKGEHHDHGSPVNEDRKTNHRSHRHHQHPNHPHHKHMHHKKADKGADDAGK